MPVIVGVDPSSKVMAWCIGHPDGTFALGRRTIRAATKEVFGPSTCLLAHGAARQMVYDLPKGTVHVFLEEPVVGRSGIHATMIQAMVSGAFQAALVEASCHVHLVNNQVWKRDIGVERGVQAKLGIQRAVERLWPIAYRDAGGDQDIIDAIGIQLYGAGVLRRSAGLDPEGSVPGA